MKRCWLKYMVVALLAAASPPAAGVERSQDFLDALRERGLHDMALVYLDEMKDSPLVTDDFKSKILFEQGATLVDWARRTGDTKKRETYFADAREKLEAFVAANPTSLLSAKANNLLANILVEQARTLLRIAEQPASAAKKEEHLAAARTFFDDARAVFEAAEKFYQDELKDSTKFPKLINAQQQPQLFEQRQEYRGELVQSKLLIATVIYEKAKSYSPDSAEFKELLTEAAAKYGAMYENYRTWLAGLYARMYQGRCFQEMKDYKTAMSYYEDLLIQDENAPAFRLLITKTHKEVCAALIAQEKYDEAITRVSAWLKKARGTENRDPEWLAVKFELARAEMLKAESLAKDGDSKGQKEHLKEARSLAADVARYANEYQAEAKKMQARLGVDRDADKEPQTFDEAFEVAKTALDVMEATKQLLPIIKQNNPDEYDANVEKIAESKGRAEKYFDLAMSLVDEKTDVNKLNLVRYYMCYLNWDAGRYYDAAVMGEFLARKYPDASVGRLGAKIAMAAYLNSYNRAGNPDKDYDAGKVVDVAQWITKKWPGESEADEAYNMLVSFMIQQGKFAEGAAYLDKISPDFSARGNAELKVGQSLWAEYIRRLRQPEGERPAQSDLDAMKHQAQATLEKGVERMRGEAEISETMANSALSLSQIYLDTSQSDKAVAMLEDEQIGPVSLLNAKHPATAREAYAEEVYKTALRAYVTSKPPQLEKAETIMDTLEAMVGQAGDAASAERLTKIFIGLGLQLESMISVVKEEGKQDEVEQIARSFEVFLDRVSAREKGNTWASRNWVAHTYYNLGKGFGEGRDVSPQGKTYYGKAVAAYQKILEEVQKDSSFAPSPDSALAVRMRLATCQRSMGQYSDALNLLSKVLAEKPMMLDAQLVAAYTYQERGEVEKPAWYYYAIHGGRKDKKTNQNQIWGWGKLATMAAPQRKYRDVFHEARYNLAYSRYQYALGHENRVDQEKHLGRAKTDIRVVAKLYPDLGGTEWKEKYDALLKKIQKSLNEKSVGLKEFEVPSTS